jgi:ribosomal protein RSM22 (predicted rRNA methylase)
VLEPALKESARQLMRVRDALVQTAPQVQVFAPCIHRNSCPMLLAERDWCHETLDYALPKPLAEVARAAGLRYEGLSYAALVLAQKPRVLGANIDMLYRIVSDPLPSKGKLTLYGCGEHGHQSLTCLTRDESADNQAFTSARRGHILRVPSLRVSKTDKIEKI